MGKPQKEFDVYKWHKETFPEDSVDMIYERVEEPPYRNNEEETRLYNVAVKTAHLLTFYPRESILINRYTINKTGKISTKPVEYPQK